MKIKLLATGKTDDSYWKEALDVYQQRLVHYIPFELEVIPDVKNVKTMTEWQQKEL
jgi:23S rRNA (pseudouridine1915-N3)-methyltransferase